MRRGHGKALTLAGALLLGCGARLYGQTAAGGGDNGTVSREEYEAIKRDNDALKKDNAALKNDVQGLRQEFEAFRKQKDTGDNKDVTALRAEVATLRQSEEEKAKEADENADEVNKLIKDVTEQTRANAAGITKLVITGDAAVGFFTMRGSPSTFGAGVAPRFLWELNDRILFDAAFDIGVERDDAGDNTTAFDLTIANLSFLVNDYIVVGAGEFVVPFGQYHPHYDPPWINALPDDPLVFSDGGLAPGSAVGAFVQGAVPIFSTAKVNYAFYLSNGPALDTTGADTAGSLDFDNFTDLNNGKAVGGRVGFMPIPELEFGYSFQLGRASPQGFSQNVDALLQGVDISYRKELSCVRGTVRARAEWIWSHVDPAVYDTGSGSFTFKNSRNGGYVLVSYRPTMLHNRFLQKLEGVVRYDRMEVSSAAPGGGREQRWTVGLDYWFDPRVVLKTAYEFDRNNRADVGNNNAFFVQLGVGF